MSSGILIPCFLLACVVLGQHAFLQYIAISGLFCCLVGALRGPYSPLLLLGLAALSYGLAFLATPLAMSFSAYGAHPALLPSPGANQIALLLLGCLWALTLVRLAPKGGPMTMSPCGRGVAMLGLLSVVACLALHWAPVYEDVPWLGDEGYHMLSVLSFRRLLDNLLGSSLFVMGLLVWLALGILLFMSLKKATTRFTKLLLLLWVISLLGLVTVVALWSYGRLPFPGFLQTRAIRYPTLQPWFSAILLALPRASWHGQQVMSVEHLRLLPLLGLAGLLFVCLRRLRRGPLLLLVLSALAIASIPNLRYHASMLYLELPMLPLLLLVLLQATAWVKADANQLVRRSCFWAVLFLGFCKDTGIVVQLLLVSARAGSIFYRVLKSRGSDPPATPLRVLLRDEGLVLIAILGPSLVYLFLRGVSGMRGYHFHPETLFSTDLWQEAVTGVVKQAGVLLLFGVCGLGVLVYRRRWSVFLLAAYVSLGVFFFHFLEDPEWVGLARFNLLLVPGVLVGALHAIRFAANRSPQLTSLGLAAVLGLNLAYGPVNLGGEHLPWGRSSGEYWYPYGDCLAEVQEAAPDASLWLANMSERYAVELVLMQLGWDKKIFQLRPLLPGDESGNMRASLQLAAEKGIDFVIYRMPQRDQMLSGVSVFGFCEVQEYAHPTGRLVLFQRDRNLPPPIGEPSTSREGL